MKSIAPQGSDAPLILAVFLLKKTPYSKKNPLRGDVLRRIKDSNRNSGVRRLGGIIAFHDELYFRPSRRIKGGGVHTLKQKTDYDELRTHQIYDELRSFSVDFEMSDFIPQINSS